MHSHAAHLDQGGLPGGAVSFLYFLANHCGNNPCRVPAWHAKRSNTIYSKPSELLHYLMWTACAPLHCNVTLHLV